MSNSSRLWTAGDFVDVFVGWHHTRWDDSCVVLGGGLLRHDSTGRQCAVAIHG